MCERCGRVVCEGRVIGVHKQQFRAGRVPMFWRVV